LNYEILHNKISCHLLKAWFETNSEDTANKKKYEFNNNKLRNTSGEKLDKNMRFFAGCRMTKKGYPFFDIYQSTLSCHPEDSSPKDPIFKFYKNHLFLARGTV
jgi:hypothetical protein